LKELPLCYHQHHGGDGRHGGIEDRYYTNTWQCQEVTIGMELRQTFIAEATSGTKQYQKIPNDTHIFDRKRQESF